MDDVECFIEYYEFPSHLSREKHWLLTVSVY